MKRTQPDVILPAFLQADRLTDERDEISGAKDQSLGIASRGFVLLHATTCDERTITNPRT
ncbi:MAG TPA: hypothetical protein VL282_14455 [Tepidisphaeraceae bacterium]|nr:hypothetical protein [Tepidisphaeraceae bacterium]